MEKKFEIRMLRLLYVSNTSRQIHQEDVDNILIASRRNNARLGITGMLLHIDGGFMQVLEGEPLQVRELFQRISSDPRHWNAQPIFSQEGERAFLDWSMGFSRLTEAADPTIFAISKSAIEGKIKPDSSGELMTMLKTFYKVQTNTDL